MYILYNNHNSKIVGHTSAVHCSYKGVRLVFFIRRIKNNNDCFFSIPNGIRFYYCIEYR